MSDLQPTLRSSRLLLRPFVPSDASDVQGMAGDKRIAATTIHIPHPYPEGAAEQWIGTHSEGYITRKRITFAITEQRSSHLIGAVGLSDIALHHARAEVVYWVGVAHWSKGYCSEAVHSLIEYASQSLGITRIVARCMANNPASARVMEKVGMKHEGTLPLHVEKWGKYEDILLYGLCLPERNAGPDHQSRGP